MAAKPTASTAQSTRCPGAVPRPRRPDRHERRRRDRHDARDERSCNRGQGDLHEHDRGPAPPDHAQSRERDAVARRGLHLTADDLTDGDDDRDRGQQREQRERDRLGRIALSTRAACCDSSAANSPPPVCGYRRAIVWAAEMNAAFDCPAAASRTPPSKPCTPTEAARRTRDRRGGWAGSPSALTVTTLSRVVPTPTTCSATTGSRARFGSSSAPFATATRIVLPACTPSARAVFRRRRLHRRVRIASQPAVSRAARRGWPSCRPWPRRRAPAGGDH